MSLHAVPAARCRLRGPKAPVAVRGSDAGGPDQGHPPVYFPEFREFRPTTVYDRYALAAGDAFDGPAIVEERESTLVIGPGGCFEVAASGNVIVTIA